MFDWRALARPGAAGRRGGPRVFARSDHVVATSDRHALSYRPVRGVIDILLEDLERPAAVSTELQSQLRRVEQQIRWAVQKTDALAAMPGQDGRRVSRLLVVRNTTAMREVARTASETLAAAYPARTIDAVASLTTDAAWPGAAIVWMTVEHGTARLLDGPPRGVLVAR